MNYPVIYVHVTQMMRQHKLRTNSSDEFFDLLNDIQPIKAIHSIVGQVVYLQTSGSQNVIRLASRSIARGQFGLAIKLVPTPAGRYTIAHHQYVHLPTFSDKACDRAATTSHLIVCMSDDHGHDIILVHVF